MNKYTRHLEKKAILGTIGLAALHAGGLHTLQNFGMKAALKTKALSKHVANGFRQGVEGVVDTSFKNKAKEFAIGATMPEINALHTSAYHAGHALAPHLAKMNLKQKAGLHMLVSGKADLAIRKGLHKLPGVEDSYNVVRGRYNLPELKDLGKKLDHVAKDKSTPITNNILSNIHKGSNPIGPNFKPGVPSSKSGLAGALASTVADPVLGGVNTAKEILQSKTVQKYKLGKKMVDGLESMFVKQPFEKGLHGNVKTNKIRDVVNDAALGPINTQLKRLGDNIQSKL